MIFLLVYTLTYLAAVLGTVRLMRFRETNFRDGLRVSVPGVLMLLTIPLGFISPPVWLLAVLGLWGYAVRVFARELRYRNRTVRYLRGQGPRPPVPGKQKAQAGP